MQSRSRSPWDVCWPGMASWPPTTCGTSHATCFAQSIGVTVVFGLLSLWGSHGDGKIPGMSPLCGLDPYHISSAHCIADKTDAIARWKGLSPALAILNKVNPVVATWVREKHQRGLVTFGGGDRTKGDPAGAWPSMTCSGAASS